MKSIVLFFFSATFFLTPTVSNAVDDNWRMFIVHGNSLDDHWKIQHGFAKVDIDKARGNYVTVRLIVKETTSLGPNEYEAAELKGTISKDWKIRKMVYRRSGIDEDPLYFEGEYFSHKHAVAGHESFTLYQTGFTVIGIRRDFGKSSNPLLQRTPKSGRR